MLLKTKFEDEDFKLGEVVVATMGTGVDGRMVVRAKAKSGGFHTFHYADKKQFDEDWEDS